MEKEIEELNKQIALLLKRLEDIEGNQTHIHHHYAPNSGALLPYINHQNPNLHYHGAQPCYNNPCIWS